jgi:hypothetical protein
MVRVMQEPYRYLIRKFAKAVGAICASILIWSYAPANALCQMVKELPGTQLQAAAGEEMVRGFTLKGAGNIRLIVKSEVSPTLEIVSYTTGAEQMTFLVGSLIATGAGLVFVAPLTMVPAAVGPLANTGAGAGAAGVATGESWGIGSLLGGSRARILREVVSSVDLVANLQSALERFLRVKHIAAGDTKGELEVVIAGYGFQTSQASEACCFIDVRTFLRTTDIDQKEDRVLLGWGAEGEDIPPAHCTGLKRFLENDGILARQAMTESAEIAAAVIVQRLHRRQP